MRSMAFTPSPHKKNKRRQRAYGAGQPLFKRALVPALRHQTRGPELKSMDFVITETQISTIVSGGGGGTTQWCLNDVIQGAAFYNRIGNKIEMKSLEVRLPIIPSSTTNTSGTTEYIRAIIYYDAQPNGQFPAIADVLSSYAADGTITSGSIDFLNMNNRERFKVFMDVAVNLGQISNNTATSECQLALLDTNRTETNIHRYIRMKRLVCNYKASAGTVGSIGDIATGAINLLIFSNAFNQASTSTSFQLRSRLRYYDS